MVNEKERNKINIELYVKAIKKQLGLKIKDICDVFDISYQTYYNWLNGRDFEQERLMNKLKSTFDDVEVEEI